MDLRVLLDKAGVAKRTSGTPVLVVGREIDVKADVVGSAEIRGSVRGPRRTMPEEVLFSLGGDIVKGQIELLTRDKLPAEKAALRGCPLGIV